jgi:hypothetical protein
MRSEKRQDPMWRKYWFVERIQAADGGRGGRYGCFGVLVVVVVGYTRSRKIKIPGRLQSGSGEVGGCTVGGK